MSKIGVNMISLNIDSGCSNNTSTYAYVKIVPFDYKVEGFLLLFLPNCHIIIYTNKTWLFCDIQKQKKDINIYF